jgi:hypothetical protein
MIGSEGKDMVLIIIQLLFSTCCKIPSLKVNIKYDRKKWGFLITDV